MSERKKAALVTGASSGIGAAFAEVLASEGFDLVITARREARLEAIAERLAREYGARVHVIPCDLARPGSVAGLCAELERRGAIVDALVNSAGFGVPGVYTASGWSLYEDMLQMMVVAVSELTYRLLPGMIDRRHGRIVNVASLAGLVPAGAGTLYGAAKAFVVNFSISLSREVSRHGVHVTAICPGLTQTEFHDRPGMRSTVTALPRWMWMDPLTVARQGFAAVTAGTPVYVNGRVNRLLVAMLRYVPLPILSSVGRSIASLRSRRGSVHDRSLSASLDSYRRFRDNGHDARVLRTLPNELPGCVLLDRMADPADGPADGEEGERRS